MTPPSVFSITGYGRIRPFSESHQETRWRVGLAQARDCAADVGKGRGVSREGIGLSKRNTSAELDHKGLRIWANPLEGRGEQSASAERWETSPRCTKLTKHCQRSFVFHIFKESFQCQWGTELLIARFAQR